MLAQRKLDTLIAATPPPNQPYTIIVGCPPGEQHTFIPLLLSLFLRRRGLKVIYLGANVPTQRFNETLQSVKPHLVILSAQLLQTASGLRDTAAYLNSNGGRVAYGGRIFNYFPELRKRIPAHFLGESIDDAIQFVDKLLISNTPLNATYPIREEDKLINNKFAQKRSIIDLYALIEAEKIGISKEFASTAIKELGKNLSSSLSLGYLDAIQAEIEWIVGLLQEYGHKKPDLVHFITAYSDAIIKAMGTEGQPIADWFIQHMAIVEN